jgi:hypothetical protein
MDKIRQDASSLKDEIGDILESQKEEWREETKLLKTTMKNAQKEATKDTVKVLSRQTDWAEKKRTLGKFSILSYDG